MSPAAEADGGDQVTLWDRGARRAKDLPGHLDDILAKKPRAVWLQLGIRDDEFARRLAAEGIEVVQDRCLMVEHRRWARARS